MDYIRTHPSLILWSLVGLAGLVLFTILLWPSKTPSIVPQPTPSLPSADTVTPIPLQGPTTRITGQTGYVLVKDFLDNGETALDPQSMNVFYLAGSPGYCISPGNCPHGALVTDFNITFNTTSQSFIIVLLAEPLGRIRQDAEQFLQDRLGISEEQLCTLNYYISTVNGINASYAGKNVGFSFCPGATVLP